MKNAVVIIFFFLCLISCKKEQSKTSVIKSTESLKNFENRIEKEKEEKINLDYFEIIPDTIDGCAYTFGYDSINKSLSKDIFVSNIFASASVPRWRWRSARERKPCQHKNDEILCGHERDARASKGYCKSAL